MFKKLEEVEKKFERLGQELQEPGVADNQKRYRGLMKDYADLETIVLPFREYKRLSKNIAENIEILESEKDEEMRRLVKADLTSVESEKNELENRLKILLLPKDPKDDRNVIIEIRAGAGGDEASLFADQLFRAYSFFAADHKWDVSVMSTSPGNVGGYKEIIATISGEKVYSIMKYESGVHRVQRVPKTEAQGRVHTSTITVAVIPETDEVEIQLNPKDLRVDTMRASGSGGQSVNRTDSAVRITHIPSGLFVACQIEKSQHGNRDRAMKMLAAKLQAIEDEKASKEASDTRLSQIGTGDRSERIRTYNYPQSRITDHRIGFTTHQLSEVMDGKFSIIVEPVITYFQAEALKQQTTQ